MPGREFGDALGRVVEQPRVDVGEPGLRVDVVELGSFDERVDGGGAQRGRVFSKVRVAT